MLALIIAGRPAGTVALVCKDTVAGGMRTGIVIMRGAVDAYIAATEPTATRSPVDAFQGYVMGNPHWI